MLKKSILAVIALGAVQFANAQQIDSVVTKEVRTSDKFRVETNHFKDNWFISGQLGLQMTFSDYTRYMDFGDRLSPAFDLNFGKWFTPSIGVRFGLSGLHFNGVAGKSDNLLHLTPATRHWSTRLYSGFIESDRAIDEAATKEANQVLFKTNMKFLNAHADVMFNISDMFWGYKRDRFYSAIPYATLGAIVSLDRPFAYGFTETELKSGAPKVEGRRTHQLTGGFGLLNRFRLNDKLSVDLDVRATYSSDKMDGQIGGRWGEGFLQTFVGLTYNFGKSHWDQSTNTVIRVQEGVLNDLREQVEQAQMTNEDLRLQLEDALEREVTASNVCTTPLLVTFRIDRWKLNNKDRVNLGFLAEAIKANPNMVYCVTGFADKGTGSVRRNIFLAKKRSEVIYNCLVNEFGVPERQLKRDSKGGVANMYYNDPRCSRAVLVKLAE